MKHKSLQLKKWELTEEGTFTAYASIFGIVDRANEQTVKGCFSDSLEEYANSGKTVKMLWNHDPEIVLGKWLLIEEDDSGLLVKGQFDLETQAGYEKYIQLKNGSIDSLSIGYITLQDSEADDGSIILNKVELLEISLVAIPCLPEALVIDVKSVDEEQEETAQEDEPKAIPETELNTQEDIKQEDEEAQENEPVQPESRSSAPESGISTVLKLWLLKRAFKKKPRC